MLEKKVLVINLVNIEYSGDKIGSEFDITISIDSKLHKISKIVKHSSAIDLCVNCLEGEITEKKEDFWVSIEAIEKDKISDQGSVTQNIKIDFQNENIQEHKFNVQVVGEGGDKGKIGKLTFRLEFKLLKTTSSFLYSEVDLPVIIQELAAVIYAEGRGETLLGQYLIATVIYNRARLTYLYSSNEGDFGNAFAESRIRGIIRHNNQFDGYNNTDYQTYLAKKTIDSSRPFEPSAATTAELIAQAVLLINQDSIDRLSILLTGIQGVLPTSRHVFFSAYPEGYEDAPKRIGQSKYKYVTLPVKVGRHYFQSFKPNFEDPAKRIYKVNDRD